MGTSELKIGWKQPPRPRTDALPAAITQAASQQTFRVIGALVDRGRSQQAFRAYAYFRWVDDWLDGTLRRRSDRLAFVARQRAIVAAAYAGEPLPDPAVEEQMAVDLIAADRDGHGGLRLYFEHLLAVMAFDAERRGRLISAPELDEYTHHLAVGVTEALHYFIGHDDPTPQVETRYLAVTGAHITHMLRDTCEDVAAGYFNVPYEFLAAQGIGPGDVQTGAYRDWVESRVRLARECFTAGRDYLTQVQNSRCRLAGHSYCEQFERVLDGLEASACWLRFDEQNERI